MLTVILIVQYERLNCVDPAIRPLIFDFSGNIVIRMFGIKFEYDVLDVCDSCRQKGVSADRAAGRQRQRLVRA